MLGQPAQVGSVEPERDSIKGGFVLRISRHDFFVHARILIGVASVREGGFDSAAAGRDAR
jgi:hypothetical protein